MRPNTVEAGQELYECTGCGSRTGSPDAGPCDECGGTLLHLGRSRDL